MPDVLKTAITEALEAMGLAVETFSVEHPADFSHGDYASNVAMVAAKQLGQNPREVAENIKEKLEGQIEYVERIEVAGPGFLNFHLSRDFFTQEASRAYALGKDWGRGQSQLEEEVLVEYTSPNLFKPLHIGNLVGNIIGESLTRLFEAEGANVHRLNYPSDIGLTVAKGVWGLRQINGNPDSIEDLGRAYVAGNEAYEVGGNQKEEIEAVNRSLYAGDDKNLNELRERGIATSQAKLDSLCALLGTTFDTVITESEAGPVGTEIVRDHQGKVFEESEGAIVYKGEKAGLHTRVFLNSQGLPTYEAKDLGNFTLKQKEYPAWTQSVIVTGGEQTEYFKVLFAAIKEVWPEVKNKTLEHVPTGFLTLTTGKMSSRKGNVLTGETLLTEVEERAKERAAESRGDDIEKLSQQIAVAALKYQILRQKVGSDIVFDKERALSFEGDSGPYLQYTNARINSVIEKAETVGVESSIAIVPETVYEIERYLYQFPEIVEQSLVERAPHHLTIYLTELAGAFNTFYASEKIADSSDQYAPYKLTVTHAVGQTLKNGLWMLGIESPEKM